MKINRTLNELFKENSINGQMDEETFVKVVEQLIIEVIANQKYS